MFGKKNDVIELGDKVKDKITGLTGTATGKIQYLTGCIQFCVTGKAGKDGKYPEAHWMDVDRLEVVKKQAVSIEVKTDGAMSPPSARY